jgi:predicted AlkP superfamily pyrophosphatase or phosphodiesterase
MICLLKAPFSDLSALRTAGFEVLRSTPFGNTFTKDFAKEAILAEKLGKGEATDFLTLSFSSTDYIGHLFGPNSVEIEDTYARLDRDIADFLKFLDDYLGKDKVLVFLTSDHGVAHVPDFLKQNRIPGGVIDSGMLLDSLSRYLKGVFGHQVISCYINQQIYINYPLLDEKQISSKEVQERIAAFLLRFKGVSGTITSFSLMNNEFGKGINSLINNGFYLKRSGDIIVTLEPGWFEGKRSGSTHGQAYSYDTHVPLLWYGWKVRKGSDVKPRNITDIAPTLAEMLRIESPSGCSGVPISELMPD